MDLNRVQIKGKLGADPEVKTTKTGKTVLNFNVATGQEFIDKKTGETRGSTEWVRVVFWCNKPESAVGLKKGTQVYLEGKLQTGMWQDDQGKKNYTTEVVINSIDVIQKRPSASEGTEYVNPADDMPF